MPDTSIIFSYVGGLIAIFSRIVLIIIALKVDRITEFKGMKIAATGIASWFIVDVILFLEIYALNSITFLITPTGMAITAYGCWLFYADMKKENLNQIETE